MYILSRKIITTELYVTGNQQALPANITSHALTRERCGIARDTRVARRYYNRHSTYDLTRAGHFFRAHQAVEFGAADKTEPHRFLAQGGAVGVRRLGHLRRLVVADAGAERGHQHERSLHQFADARLVGLYPHHAIVGERRRRVAEQADRLQYGVGEHRFVNVELEMALAAGHRDGGLVAEHLTAHHGERLALGRIGLARHNRGTELVARQDQFAQPRARAGAEQADIVGNLEQRGGGGVERAVHEHIGVVTGHVLELVGSADKGKFCELSDAAREGLGEFRLGIEPGADRGAALGEGIKFTPVSYTHLTLPTK